MFQEIYFAVDEILIFRLREQHRNIFPDTNMMIRSLTFLLITAKMLLCISAAEDCKRLRISYCSSLGFTKTYKTNLLNQASQRDVVKSKIFQDLQTLDSLGCSDLVKPFACSIYAPICFQKWGALPPCRSVCTAIKQSCKRFLSLMDKRKSQAQLDCSYFPEPGPKTGCVNWAFKDLQHVMEVKGNPSVEQRKKIRIPKL